MRDTSKQGDTASAEAELASVLRQGFGGRADLGMEDLTKLLNLDQKTLLRHVRAGKLPFRSVGTGRKRIRRRFTMGDVMAFYRNAGSLAAEPGPRAARPGAAVPSSTAGGLIGFIPRPTRPGRSR